MYIAISVQFNPTEATEIFIFNVDVRNSTEKKNRTNANIIILLLSLSFSLYFPKYIVNL
jgi:hypothetical protein